MTTTTKVEVSPESARAALKRAQGLLHIWAPLVRAIARNPKLKVQLTGGAPCTDGKTVWLRVPIELAFEDHDKAVCGKWDEVMNQYLCPACQVEMDCDMALFHEVSHLLAGSFGHEDPDAELVALLTEAYPKVKWDLRAMSLSGARKNHDNTLVNRVASRFPDHWGFFVFNVVEDVYVNDSITEARKGLVAIFESFYEKIMRDGILMEDGRRKVFSELHPFIQACSAWSLIASGQEAVTKYLDPAVVATVKDSEILMDLASKIGGTHSLRNRFKVAMKLLLELERIGFVAREPEPEEEEESPGEGGEPCEDGDPAEGEGEGDGTGGKGEGDTSGDAEGDPDGAPGEGDKPEGGIEVDTDKDSPTTSPGEGSGDTAGSGDPKNEDDDESDSDDGDSDPKNEDDDESDSDDGDAAEGAGDDKSEGADTHGDSADVSEDGDGEAGDSEGEGADGPATDSEAAPSDGSASLEDTGGGKIDHDAEAEASEGGSVELPTIEEAREAFEALTGHEGFGDADDMEAALSDIEEPADEEATELIESALSFDGVLDHIDGRLVVATVNASATTDYNGPLVGERGGDYDLPTEIMAPAAQRMRLAFAANRKIGNVRGLTSGPKLDNKTLGYRIPTGDPRIFARREIPKKRDWTVLIGIDASGSTAGGALETEKQVAIGIGDLLTQLGIPFSMYAHTGQGVRRSGGPGYELIIVPLKGEHQLWKGDGRDNARRLRSGAANLDGHTMQAYRKMLERQKGRDKLLLYFTDGAMPCENGVEEKQVLIQECAVLKAKRIHTIGVGIGCDDPRRYGLDTIEVNSTRDIPALLQGIGERLTH